LRLSFKKFNLNTRIKLQRARGPRSVAFKLRILCLTSTHKFVPVRSNSLVPKYILLPGKIRIRCTILLCLLSRFSNNNNNTDLQEERMKRCKEQAFLIVILGGAN
jgi:hypothetical protein